MASVVIGDALPSRLFGDWPQAKTRQKHAYIKRVGDRYVLVNNRAPADHTLVNERPVSDQIELQDGDRIQLGNVLLRFHRRAAANRARARRPVPAAMPASSSVPAAGIRVGTPVASPRVPGK